MDHLSQAVIALSTWAWLEVHSSSVLVLVATLLAMAVVGMIAAAVLAVALRMLRLAHGPDAASGPIWVVAAFDRTAHRPRGGRGPRAPGGRLGRLALV